MVGIVLRVVVFEQKTRGLNPVVMRIPQFHSTSPGEKRAWALKDRRTLRDLICDCLAILGDILPHELQQHLLLRCVELFKGRSLARVQSRTVDLPLSSAHNLTGRLGRNNGLLFLLVSQGTCQFPSQVLFLRQCIQSLEGARFYNRRVAAPEGRRRAESRAIDQHEVYRQVVAFKAPAPRLFRGGCAIDGHMIHLTIADRIAVLNIAQNRLQRHHGCRLQLPLMTQCCVEQPKCKTALHGRHLFDLQATAAPLRCHHGTGDVMPGCAFVRIKRHLHSLAFALPQRGEEAVGGLSHLGRHIMRVTRCRRRPSPGDQDTGQGDSKPEQTSRVAKKRLDGSQRA